MHKNSPAFLAMLPSLKFREELFLCKRFSKKLQSMIMLMLRWKKQSQFISSNLQETFWFSWQVNKISNVHASWSRKRLKSLKMRPNLWFCQFTLSWGLKNRPESFKVHNWENALWQQTSQRHLWL
jgi:hypothetical protein